MQSAVFFLVILTFSFCYVSANGPRWDGLSAMFGTFKDLPRTVNDAVKNDYTKISDCSLTAPWRGNRYIANNDRTLALLYDVNGFIAGIQILIPKNFPSGYPTVNLQPFFGSDGDFWVTTAYFVRPDEICTRGRSQSDFNIYGTGRSLYIQNGVSPEASVNIPNLQKDVAGTAWTLGKCFPTMGTHYWWYLSGYSKCEAFAPWFLMYNDGLLSAFGFVFATNLTSSIFGRPAQNSYKLFMDPVPECLLTPGVIMNTLHVYMVSNARQIACNANSPTTGG